MSARATKPIKYRIALFGEFTGYLSLQNVIGFAVDYPFDVRVCARKVRSAWQLDDYDTGASLASIGLHHKSLDKLLELGESILPTYIKDGSYADRQTQALTRVGLAMGSQGQA